MTRRSIPARSHLVLLVAALGVPAAAVGQERPTLTPADYGQWESLVGFELDPTGRWLSAAVRRVDESVEIRLTRTSGEGGDLVLEHASGGVFSRDGRWLAYRKGVSPDERKAAEEPVRDRLGLVDLRTGTDTVLMEVSSFAFGGEGAWIAVLGHAPADTVGADLLVLDPTGPTRGLLGNVEEYVWQEGGELLAATLRTAWGSANSVIVFDPAAGTLRTLDSRGARYRDLTWRDESAQLAVLRSVEDERYEGDSHDVLVWNDARSSQPPRILRARGRPDLPDTLKVSERGGIEFNSDGSAVFIGLRGWEARLEAEGEAEREASADTAQEDPGDDARAREGEAVGPADVQVWHWNDDQILRAQEYYSERREGRTFLAAWHLDDDEIVVLGSDLDEPVRMLEGGAWGLVPDYTPYLVPRRFGAGSADWYRVDPRDGARVRIARAVDFPQGVQTGPEGSTVLVHEDAGWTAIDVGTLERIPLGHGTGGDFRRSLFDFDYPGPRPPWGVGGWFESEAAVLLHDARDVWRADLASGSIERLTRGAEEGREYRVVNLDPDASPFQPGGVALDPDVALWLAVRDVRTKASGYARVDPDGTLHPVLFEEADVRSLAKARDADRYAYRVERWDDSPDVFVAGEDLTNARQVTRTNPFQSEYAWGRAELIPYTTEAGHDLQAILVYPADFEEGRRYPLILYQYERLSDGLHRYVGPSRTSYYNQQVWSQEGYFVLLPDIVYEPGRPGPSALDAVEHALDAAVATGHVDPDRMGLIGHSWGGYQASYLPTRTHRFAASVAGAAITNFLSFMGAVHWNGGLPETAHWETGQARMAVPFWEDLEGHLESSPANFVHELETPMLLMHGDADGVVDFRQGLEFYNYARRAGKEVVLLVYPGADHGLREEKQQVDYHRRILAWFAHYLKGEPAERWITDGESWEERARRLGGP